MSDENLTHEEEVDDEGMPYQFDVYFKGFPALDLDKLKASIDGLELKEPDKCTVESTQDESDCDDDIGDGEKLRVDGFLISLGEMFCAVLVHDAPSPAADIIADNPRLPDDIKTELGAHKCFALLNIVGGDGYKPVEKMIFMYKITIAFAEQGAIGFGCPYTHMVFPTNMLQDVVQLEADDPEATIWDAMRNDGQPFDFLADISGIELNGKQYLGTIGFGYYGFPDLFWEYEEDGSEDIFEMFGNCFSYMMENGPVFQAGHTMGHDENVAFRFEDFPEILEIPYPVLDALLVIKEVTKKKKFLGLF